MSDGLMRWIAAVDCCLPTLVTKGQDIQWVDACQPWPPKARTCPLLDIPTESAEKPTAASSALPGPPLGPASASGAPSAGAAALMLAARLDSHSAWEQVGKQQHALTK
eukprot:1159145-Pelagomonas_calceolata.AAC.26